MRWREMKDGIHARWRKKAAEDEAKGREMNRRYSSYDQKFESDECTYVPLCELRWTRTACLPRKYFAGKKGNRSIRTPPP